MTGVAISVRGTVDTAQLGVVDGHQHLVAPAARRRGAQEPDLDLDDPARVEVDLAAFRAAGGRTLVEMTTVDYGRDLEAVARLAERSGVTIIAATGFNKGRYCRDFCEGRDPEELARVQVREVVHGSGPAGIRCGVVKLGTSLDRIEPWEERAALAAAHTHLATGCPISTHTEAGTMALEQLDLLEAAGVPPGTVIVGHLDRRPDPGLHREIASRGAYLGYDQLPKPKYATAAAALELIVALARAGLHRQLLLGGDLSRRSYFAGWGGGPGLAFLPEVFRPRLRETLARADLDPDPILHDLFVANPARALAVREVTVPAGTPSTGPRSALTRAPGARTAAGGDSPRSGVPVAPAAVRGRAAGDASPLPDVPAAPDGSRGGAAGGASPPSSRPAAPDRP